MIITAKHTLPVLCQVLTTFVLMTQAVTNFGYHDLGSYDPGCHEPWLLLPRLSRTFTVTTLVLTTQALKNLGCHGLGSYDPGTRLMEADRWKTRLDGPGRQKLEMWRNVG